jgi:thiamine pyrophosphate-dependent acetolactate synthase large subunit-like protein
MSQQSQSRRNAATGPADLERPRPSGSEGFWVSDVVTEVLKKLDIPFVALNPGASFRGLHDSLVNHGMNTNPQMLLCLHEEHVVSIAHGWAKVTERPMAGIVHSNVGLMHAAMGVFNAWCDRAPILLLGATGPVDAAKRRPWIDWIHTAQDQGALIRSYSKWDDQPASPAAIIEALLRAHMIAGTAPYGPTYVCLDAGLQETKIDALPSIPDVQRYRPPAVGEPAAGLIEQAAELLLGAKTPLILAGRVGRSEQAWTARIRLAETLDAAVLTDLKTAAAFPTTHRLHAAPASTLPTPRAGELLREADVILSLDWIDLAGTLKMAFGAEVTARVIQVSVDQTIHNGWSKDHQGLPPVDIYLMSEPDAAVARLLPAIERLGGRRAAKSAWASNAVLHAKQGPRTADDPKGETITVPTLAAAMKEATRGERVTLVRGPLAWAGHLWDIEHPLDYLGIDGGGGLGSGCGNAIGAALALRDSDRFVMSCFGDGEFLMSATALWTAVHYRIPCLIVVANNNSFYNDELHQERMARQRGRLVDNKWIGQRMSDPDIDLAMMARSQGAIGIGPVRENSKLAAVLLEAVDHVRQGQVTVVDVRVEPGYDPSTTKAMLQQAAPVKDRG